MMDSINAWSVLPRACRDTPCVGDPAADNGVCRLRCGTASTPGRGPVYLNHNTGQGGVHGKMAAILGSVGSGRMGKGIPEPGRGRCNEHSLRGASLWLGVAPARRGLRPRACSTPALRRGTPGAAPCAHCHRGREEHSSERAGFEPAERDIPFTGLANLRFKPLSHLSRWFAARATGQAYRGRAGLSRRSAAKCRRIEIHGVIFPKAPRPRTRR